MYGELPIEIGKLENLKELALSNNLFEGTLPSELSNLLKLETLLLNENKLIGDINFIIKDLSSLRNVEYNNLMKTPPPIYSNPVSQARISLK